MLRRTLISRECGNLWNEYLLYKQVDYEIFGIPVYKIFNTIIIELQIYVTNIIAQYYRRQHCLKAQTISGRECENSFVVHTVVNFDLKLSKQVR